ncbi:MAG: NAD(P)/FAD-dependent oxidoreductase [Woeseia sp.]
MTEHLDAIVVGAGHNGLVCAAYLARAGKKTLVLESAPGPGGMAGTRSIRGGYHFPGLVHVAYPFAPGIRRELELDRHGYAPGAPINTTSLAGNGRHLSFGNAGISGQDVPRADADSYPPFRNRYLSFARAMQPLFDSSPPRLKETPFRDKWTLMRLGWNLRVKLGRDSMYELLRVAGINMHDVLSDTFVDDRLKGAIAAEAILGSAMCPRTPGTVLTWLQWLQGALNGPLSIPSSGSMQALASAAEAAGATIRHRAAVRRILVEAGRATGAELASGEKLAADLTVSGVDPRSTFTELVGLPQLDAMFGNRVGQIRGSGVVAKLLLALRDKPAFRGLPEPELGNRLLVAPSLRYVEHAFNASKYGEYPEQPVLDIAIPSLGDTDLAPAGHHVMSVNVAFVPYDLREDSEARKSAFTKRVIALLDEYAPGIESLIVEHQFLSPRDIEADYGAMRGHWHHGELSIHQSFMLRPLYGAAQYDTPIGGLFLCGSGSHPGGGLTGLPGRNAARRILELGKT